MRALLGQDDGAEVFVIRSSVVVLGALVAMSACAMGCGEPVYLARARSEAAAASAKRPRVLPLPTSIWERPTNEAHYKVFANHAETARWFDAWKGSPKAAWYWESAVVMAENDARYVALSEDLAGLWRAFRELFPRDCEGLDAPQLLLTTKPGTNAHVLYDYDPGEPRNGVQLHLVLVDGGSLGRSLDPATREALRGLLAHELTHHVLKHGFPGHKEKVNRFYSTKAAKGAGFGFEQDDDPAMRELGETYLSAVAETGEYPLREWNGVVRDNAAYAFVRDLIHRESAKAAPVLCKEADEARAKLDAFAETILSYAFMSVRASPAQLLELDALSKAYVAAESACAAIFPKTLFEVLAEMTGKTEAAVRALSPPDDRTINDGAKSAFDALAKKVSASDAALLGMDVSTLRYYTAEEQADDVAIAVLFKIGADPLAGTNFLEKIYVVGADRVICEKEIAAGEPTYGVLSVSHHAPCWRIAHGRALARWLATPS